MRLTLRHTKGQPLRTWQKMSQTRWWWTEANSNFHLQRVRKCSKVNTTKGNNARCTRSNFNNCEYLDTLSRIVFIFEQQRCHVIRSRDRPSISTSLVRGLFQATEIQIATSAVTPRFYLKVAHATFWFHVWKLQCNLTHGTCAATGRKRNLRAAQRESTPNTNRGWWLAN